MLRRLLPPRWRPRDDLGPVLPVRPRLVPGIRFTAPWAPDGLWRVESPSVAAELTGEAVVLLRRLDGLLDHDQLSCDERWTSTVQRLRVVLRGFAELGLLEDGAATPSRSVWTPPWPREEPRLGPVVPAPR